MRWKLGRPSANVEDRRGESAGWGARRLPFGVGGFLVLLVLSAVFHKNLFALLDSPGGAPAPMTANGPTPVPQSSAQEDELVQFVSFVLEDAQGSWVKLFPSLGGEHQDAKLVLFRDAIESTCGFTSAASGPFYCGLDRKVYVDLGFYDDLRDRFGAPGDFAQAYVIAHEIGHHVQNLLGVQEQVRRAQSSDPGSANELSVRLELQADCYAGGWGHEAAQRGVLDPGDLDEGLTAAAAIGDDRIQRSTTGRIVPEAFTHGSSEQRTRCFRRGLESGRCEDCDTFAGQIP